MEPKNGTSLLPEWEFYIDTGGTFTDCLGRGPGGKEIRVKVLSRGSLTAKVKQSLSPGEILLEQSTDWPDHFPIGFRVILSDSDRTEVAVEKWNNRSKIIQFSEITGKHFKEGQTIQLFSGEEAPLLGIRLILAREKIKQVDCLIRMRLATTRCTNALLEDSGQKPILVITKGFSDLLEIGDQRRIDLFDIIPQKRKSFAGPCVEVVERTDRTGRVLTSPDLRDLENQFQRLKDCGHSVAVVSFLNSYLNDENENTVVHSLQKIGFKTVIGSAQIHPFIKWLPRCESSVLEGYLNPTLEQYLHNIKEGLGENGQLLIMNSAGGLIGQEQYRAIDSLLSGPAGGMVGASTVAKRAGLAQTINLDMGGTSTDVSRFSGCLSYQSSVQVGEAKLAGLALHIETVAAGGGSICRVESGRLKVGPESSSAYPGPACYGFGGPLCLTDVNLLLGRLDARTFATPIEINSAQRKLNEWIDSSGLSKRELLAGFISIADDSMARAIRKISVEQGYDPTDHALLCFGGAGGQHACGVAQKLGITKILSPADSGLLSAYGLSMSNIERVVERPIHRGLDDSGLITLEEEITEAGFEQMGVYRSSAQLVRKTASVRMKGQDFGVEVEYEKISEIERLYEVKFDQIFGYLPTQGSIQIYSLRFHFAIPEPTIDAEEFTDSKNTISNVKFGKNFILARDQLQPGESVNGPGLVVDDFGSLWIEDGWRGRMGCKGSLLLEFDQSKIRSVTSPIMREELFASRFYCLVEEMGAQLKRTAISVNVRERLDFSCALLDRDGYLVANAPHIPVHLGALGLCVRETIKLFPELKSGDVLITNHPQYGGSHLPDITVIAPVFSQDGDLLCFVANRAHHSEIGGISPGSMPAGSKSLAEEGAVISPTYLFEDSQSCMDTISAIFSGGEFPTRQLEENRADLSAQVASLRQGITELKALESEHSANVLHIQMKNLAQESLESCQNFFRNWGNGTLTSVQYLDDGDQLKLQISLSNGQATFDFSGTCSSRKDNLNATEAITQSVICYCLRLLINEDLPLNEGILAPVKIIIPKGSILSPVFSQRIKDCPGVAGGNVEISQKLVDLIMSAFDRVACSQGTMNNITFGNESFSHYETIGGGAGAMIGQHGTSAVQVHMTNTAITDPEILEARFPVRLLGFKVRKKSGGKGTWNGGDGIEREYIFEETTNLSLLTQNRNAGADGIAGGGSGEPGEQIVVRKNGKTEVLSSIQSLLMKPGDRLILSTPGGGGAGHEEVIS
ncbi:MAG: hydantoinase B/oxoprolinase family protein [Opitutales bacterium]|nr:hydantoinase B/oxoprolinase family protein [Opitutales bacterium]